ncbi:MAG: lipoyl(octanoyl) transferase LipB [Pseudomonadota bacterium]|nr:lipoyl(octanoyl) transferase LipB [Pseudomonadota bacterium]
MEWRLSTAPVAYPVAIEEMEERVAAIEGGQAKELIWLLEHPSLYTKGTSAVEDELIDAGGVPVYTTGRGGRVTWHGPGQRVIYVLRDLRKHGRDVRQHVCTLEQWMIDTLREFGIEGQRREGRIGIWVDRGGRDEKIGAIGVRVRHWITYHGLALNVDPDLSAFKGIIPCGLPQFGVTSLRALGIPASMEEVDAAFRRQAGAFETRPAC